MNKKVIQGGKKARRTEKEIVEERRAEVLSQGRKFKYPLQYAKHRLVIVTLVISFLALVIVLSAGWLALYKVQDTGDIIYRVTQVLPVRVAVVEDKDVRYSDYLMLYRSSLQTVEQQSGKLGDDADAEAVKMQYKRKALNEAEGYAYAEKLAAEKGIEVTDEEVDEAFDEHRQVGGSERSEESFLKILQDNFGLSKAEYRRMLYLSLVRLKVTEAVDTEAAILAGKVEATLAGNGGDLRAVAEGLGSAVEYEETGGLVGNKNVDGGRAMTAMALEPGQVSGRFVSSNGDGYYYVQLVAKNETQVNYRSLKIPFKKFAEMLDGVRENGGITEYIEVGE